MVPVWAWSSLSHRHATVTVEERTMKREKRTLLRLPDRLIYTALHIAVVGSVACSGETKVAPADASGDGTTTDSSATDTGAADNATGDTTTRDSAVADTTTADSASSDSTITDAPLGDAVAQDSPL